METRKQRISSEFRADFDRAAAHHKCDYDMLEEVMRRLRDGRPLERHHRDHALKGRYPPRRNGYTDCRECHVGNDWLLVYRLPDAWTVHYVRTGTHSDLF